MANARVLGRSWDIMVSGGPGIYVPVACTATTSAAGVALNAGAIQPALTVANSAGISAGQGLVLEGPLTPPAAPTLAHTPASTGLGGGTVQVQVGYVNPNGTSLPSAAASVIISAGDNIQITSPPAYQNATGWYAYVTVVGGATFFQQQALGTPTNLGTNLTLTTISNTGPNPPTTDSTRGANAENVRVASVAGNVVTIQGMGTAAGSLGALVKGHLGTIAVSGGPVAPIYQAPASSNPNIISIQSLASRMQAYSTTSGDKFKLYVLAPGMLLSDAGEHCVQYRHQAAATEDFLEDSPLMYLNPLDTLCWAAFTAGHIAIQIDGLEGIIPGTTATQTST